MLGLLPAAAIKVGNQSMLIATCCVTCAGFMCCDQRTMAGTRIPPSSNSDFCPVNGQVREKRSPPLSLVKITMVFLYNPPEIQVCCTRIIKTSPSLIFYTIPVKIFTSLIITGRKMPGVKAGHGMTTTVTIWQNEAHFQCMAML